MFKLGIEEWRLFIDSYRISLIAVLLHNGSELPFVPVAYALVMKETYETMCHFPQAIKYEDHCWRICGDLKVFGLLMGLQSGFTKFLCFLFLWDSRDTKEHYKV